MTSWHENALRITIPLWRESTRHQWIPLIKGRNAGHCCFLPNKLLKKQSNDLWFETWRPCVAAVNNKLTNICNKYSAAFADYIQKVANEHIISRILSNTFWTYAYLSILGFKMCSNVFDCSETVRAVLSVGLESGMDRSLKNWLFVVAGIAHWYHTLQSVRRVLCCLPCATITLWNRRWN